MSSRNPSPAKSQIEQLQRDIEKNLMIQMAVSSILRISLEPIPLDEQLHRILDLIIQLPWLSIDAKGCIFLFDEGPMELVMKAQVNMPAGALQCCHRVPLGVCLCGHAIEHGELIFTNQVDCRHEILYPSILPHGHYCVPITFGGQRIGLVNLLVRAGHQPQPHDERFLRAVADVLAGVIKRAQVEESLRRSEERFDLAVRGTDAGIWDWDLRSGDLYFSARWKSMLGYDETEIGDKLSEWETRLHPDDRDRALATLGDYLEGRSSDYDLEHRLRHKDASYRWILARGAKVCDHEGRPYRMVGSHLDITERKHVEQRLLHREASLIAARQIVRRLLPRGTLHQEGMVVYGASLPADYVGGDHFDYFTLSDGSVLVIIADVVGHGIDAALLMALTHAWLRSLAGLPLEMGEILSRVNSVLIDEAEERFVTLAMLRIDPRSRTFVYANAGHPSGYILNKTGELKSELKSLSMPLGVEPGTGFPTRGPLSLERGDLVLLITDGAFEARSPEGDLLGIERVVQIVRERIDRPKEEIVRSLHAEICQFTGSRELLDDVTIVLAEAT